MSPQVIVVGAGPVGLTLSLLLDRAGVRTLLVERRTVVGARSMAIGVTPPSLDTFHGLGLEEELQAAGVPIREVEVFEARRPVGTLRFRAVGGAYPYVLALPQADLECRLREAVKRAAHVELRTGWEATALRIAESEAEVEIRDMVSQRFEGIVAPFVAGCDGPRSRVRDALGVPVARKRYRPRFTMADVADGTGLGDRARLHFAADRPVESFPLPGGCRRWVVRTGWGDADDLAEPLEETIRRRTGVDPGPIPAEARCGFTPSRHLARRFHRGRAVLCGDAAHGMSPIGGQGMNTGLADAACLARALVAVLHDGGRSEPRLQDYHRRRVRSFRAAAARAALGMALGTWRGVLASTVRGCLVAALLGPPPLHRRTARWFSMRNFSGAVSS